MKAFKPITKKSGKQERERKVLFGLVEQYIKTGKPVGSHTLKDAGFEDLSSATIRNYFAHLEEEGYLIQQHSSGGRIPTDKSYRFYAQTCIDQLPTESNSFASLRSIETREIASFLQNGAEELAQMTQTAVLLSAPRFEHDFIIGIKFMVIDHSRCLCILVTDFGEIRPEILYTSQKISSFATKRIEAYFNWRLNGQNKPEQLSREEEELAQGLYNELMLRYIVSYSYFGNEEIYRTNFSSLLNYPEFHDPTSLTNSLSLFENTHGMQLLLKECSKLNTLKYWIGNDLNIHSPQSSPNCAILATPYYVNKQPVGAVGIIGPMRLPYLSILKSLRDFSESISEALTRNLYKFKISMRQPKHEAIDLKQQLVGETRHLLLEDQSLSANKKLSPKPPSSRRK